MFSLWLLLLLTGVVSWAMTGLLMRHAHAKGWLDVPNQRSSHSVPTPRAGGVAIALSFLAGLFVMMKLGIVPAKVTIGLSGAGGLVAFVGYLDDRFHVRVRWRLMAHFFAALWGLYFLGGPPVLIPPFEVLDLGMLGVVCSVIYLVWMLNLYNFMDGIDGIAGIESVTVCLGASMISWLTSAPEMNWSLPLLLMFVVAGFLWWNIPPARIFMGDVGSGFLGLTLGLLSISAAHARPELFSCWIILLAVFVTDTGVTLVLRTLNREKLYEAHCTHAYQHLARRFGGHSAVAFGVGGINLFWLLPIAVGVVVGWIDEFAGIVCAYAPLTVAAIYLKAGQSIDSKFQKPLPKP